MLVRGGGPSSGYVSTGFFGGKHLVTVMLKPFLFIYIFYIRSYIGSYYLIPGYGQGIVFFLKKKSRIPTNLMANTAWSRQSNLLLYSRRDIVSPSPTLV